MEEDNERALNILAAMLRNFDARLAQLEEPLAARGIAGKRSRELRGAFRVMMGTLEEIGLRSLHHE